jgi:hypothetical protein
MYCYLCPRCIQNILGRRYNSTMMGAAIMEAKHASPHTGHRSIHVNRASPHMRAMTSSRQPKANAQAIHSTHNMRCSVPAATRSICNGGSNSHTLASDNFRAKRDNQTHRMRCVGVRQHPKGVEAIALVFGSRLGRTK